MHLGEAILLKRPAGRLGRASRWIGGKVENDASGCGKGPARVPNGGDDTVEAANTGDDGEVGRIIFRPRIRA